MRSSLEIAFNQAQRCFVVTENICSPWCFTTAGRRKNLTLSLPDLFEQPNIAHITTLNFSTVKHSSSSIMIARTKWPPVQQHGCRFRSSRKPKISYFRYLTFASCGKDFTYSDKRCIEIYTTQRLYYNNWALSHSAPQLRCAPIWRINKIT